VCDLQAAAGNTWTVSLSVDGGPAAVLEGVPFLYGMAPFEGIDVGIDRRSPVSWDLFERFGPFPFTGEMGPVHFEPGEDAPGAPSTLVGMLRDIGLKFE
jgi:arylsulfatase